MTDNEKYIKYIRKNLSEREMLEQLAEEASELSQAALKLIRAKKLSNNVTPKTEQEAVLALAEEITDCCIVIDLVCAQNWEVIGAIQENNFAKGDDVTSNPKWKRWAERLGYKEEQK